jgi:hypothetical protein
MATAISATAFAAWMPAAGPFLESELPAGSK